jgi:thioredoxin 1
MDRLIDPETEKQLKTKFAAALKGTVDVKVFSNPIIDPADKQSAEINGFAKQLVKELSGVDARIIMQDLTPADQAAKALGIKTSPSIAVGYDLGYKIIYNGAPLGYEATGLIETIVLVSQRESGLSDAGKKAVAMIEKETLYQVFVTPTCPYCPKSVLLANRIAIESKGKVTAECVECTENRELAAKYNVSSVPQQVVNGIAESSTMGALPENELVKQVLKYGAPEKYSQFEKEAMAVRAAREKLEDNPAGSVYITDGNFSEALKKYGNLVIDCWADWCTPCKMLAPVIEELSAAYAGKIVFGKLNTDENPKTSAENAIQSIPTLLVYKDGELKGSIIGVNPKQEMELKFKELFGL